MDFRDKLLSNELRHVTELVNMLSYELVILQDFLTEEFGRKYKKFRSTHVFASESTHDFSQTRGGSTTAARAFGNLGRSTTNTDASQRKSKSDKKTSQQDPLGESEELPTTSDNVPERSHQVSMITESDDEVDEEYTVTETKVISDDAENKNSMFEEEMDSDSDDSSSAEESHRLSWNKVDREAEPSRGPYYKRIWDYFEWKRLPDGRKLVRCPKCKRKVSAVAKRMERHREICSGKGGLSTAILKRENIAASSSKPTEESSFQSTSVDTDTPRTVGKPKGWVWKHFEEISTPDNQIIVKCNYCKRKVCRHATRMARHLKNCEQCPIKSDSFDADIGS